MKHELTALEKNHTWEFTTLPEGKRAIGSKWVYKVKLHLDGPVEQYKAHLVAKRYNQIEGVDIFYSFSLVVKTVTVRIMFTVASAYFWPIHQLDINSAFLHGYLDEAVYMTPPEGYDAPSGMVSHGFLALLVYVDDVLITCTSDTLIQNVKSYLDRLFTIKDLGYVKYFLGLEVARSSDGLSVSQHKYICDIVTELHLQDAKSCTTPLPFGLKFSANEGAILQEPDRVHLPWLYFSLQRIHFSLVLSWMLMGRRVLIVGEYCGMATTVCELLWITYILKDFQVPLTIPIPFWCDNQAALHITANPVFHERTKHLDIDCHIVRDKYKEGFISPGHIAGHLQPADAFTKILSVAAFTQSRVKRGGYGSFVLLFKFIFEKMKSIENSPKVLLSLNSLMVNFTSVAFARYLSQRLDGLRLD
ncbi:UNVERIFIED_CONTAM: Retrovirus-related Pol polyprotein from transposon TNT 1-94 [Sesamum latifolium]|uniref:Retrovirus-related Pol polyprotein from transposon TNT 1-94 n=1 Tax=Sesamum latifolium TaxID=2727402 RepID=A0AAW2VZ77_9LAMI